MNWSNVNNTLHSTHTHTHTHQEYTDDSQSSTDDEEVEIENQYYSSKGLKEEDPKSALAGFERVLELDQKKDKKGEWGFKALKQMLKLLFRIVS